MVRWLDRFLAGVAAGLRAPDTVDVATPPLAEHIAAVAPTARSLYRLELPKSISAEAAKETQRALGGDGGVERRQKRLRRRMRRNGEAQNAQ